MLGQQLIESSLKATTYGVEVSEVLSCLMHIYLLLPALGVSEVTPKIHTLHADGDVVVSGVSFHVIVVATALRTTERAHMRTI